MYTYISYNVYLRTHTKLEGSFNGTTRMAATSCCLALSKRMARSTRPGSSKKGIQKWDILWNCLWEFMMVCWEFMMVWWDFMGCLWWFNGIITSMMVVILVNIHLGRLWRPHCSTEPWESWVFIGKSSPLMAVSLFLVHIGEMKVDTRERERERYLEVFSVTEECDDKIWDIFWGHLLSDSPT